jgi:hypothetical protein
MVLGTEGLECGSLVAIARHPPALLGVEDIRDTKAPSPSFRAISFGELRVMG